MHPVPGLFGMADALSKLWPPAQETTPPFIPWSGVSEGILSPTCSDVVPRNDANNVLLYSFFAKNFSNTSQLHA